MVKEPIQPGQMKRLHQLLNQTSLQEYKADLVRQFSAQRAESSKELLKPEADNLIKHLESYVEQLPTQPVGTQKDQSADRMRKKMIHYAYEMRWTRNGKCDYERLNNWCLQRGKYKKKLNAHTYQELVQLVSQFEKVYKSFLLGAVKL